MNTISFSKIVDLSHTINESNPAWPDDGKINFPNYTSKILTNYKDHGFLSRKIEIPEHYGTHMDAPAHSADGESYIDQIKTENLICPGAVIDVRNRVNDNPDYLLSQDDIIEWETKNGQISNHSIVIMFSGWSKHWNNKKLFLNQDEYGTLHFPGFSIEAVNFLLHSRKINGLGVETLSIDCGSSADFPVHKLLFSKNKYALENLTNVDQLPSIVPSLVIAPLKFENGSGSPARVLAFI